MLSETTLQELDRLREEVPDLRAQLTAANERAEKAERERDYFLGYEADLLAIRKALDNANAPHDSEDGVSLEPRRIQLLAHARDHLMAENAKLRERANAFQSAADAQLKVAMQQRARAEKAERERDEAKLAEQRQVEVSAGYLIQRNAIQSARDQLAAENAKLRELLCAVGACQTKFGDDGKPYLAMPASSIFDLGALISSALAQAPEQTGEPRGKGGEA